MLLGVIGIPQLTLLDLRLSGNELGLEVACVNWQGLRQTITFFNPQKFVGHKVTPVSLYSMDALIKAYPKLEKSKRSFLVLCTAALSELHEYDIPFYRNGDSGFTSKDLKKVLTESAKMGACNPLERVRNTSEAILKEVNKDSLLQKLLTAFYRIKDKVKREEVQDIVYAYLSGRRLNGEVPSYIANTLQSELCKRFRVAVKSAIHSGDPDAASAEFKIDRFEIAFILSKTRPKALAG